MYAGDRVLCPICMSCYKEFGPYGKKKRKNARCHNCNSLERHRLVWSYIKDRKLLEEGMTLLHFAPEKVFYDLFSKMDHIEYIPCDLNPDDFNFQDKVEIAKVDITNIPFVDNSFDFILCNHVLEHIPDDWQAISELFRVMKKGGCGIFQVPIDYSRESTYEDFTITSKKGRLKAFGQRDHVRWYGKDYVNRLAHAKFKVQEDDFVNEFSEQEQFRFGFNKTEKIYFCSK